MLEKHWPAVKRYEDVREVHGAGEGHSYWFGRCYRCLEPVDLVCGGFPCQDISHAGRRTGIDGDRSGLWAEQLRLTDELGPRYLLVENVAALLGGGIGRVLGDLATIGYDAEWDCIPASAIGAPHRRDRVWILAYPNGERLEGWNGRVVFKRPGQCSTRAGGPYVPDAHHESESGSAFHASARASLQEFVRRDEWWRTEPDVGRVAHGVPARVDRLKGLGNAIVPQIAEWIGRRILEAQAPAVAAVGLSVQEA